MHMIHMIIILISIFWIKHFSPTKLITYYIIYILSMSAEDILYINFPFVVVPFSVNIFFDSHMMIFMQLFIHLTLLAMDIIVYIFFQFFSITKKIILYSFKLQQLKIYNVRINCTVSSIISVENDQLIDKLINKSWELILDFFLLV
jgi:hypothetical protein